VGVSSLCEPTTTYQQGTVTPSRGSPLALFRGVTSAERSLGAFAERIANWMLRCWFRAAEKSGARRTAFPGVSLGNTLVSRSHKPHIDRRGLAGESGIVAMRNATEPYKPEQETFGFPLGRRQYTILSFRGRQVLLLNRC